MVQGVHEILMACKSGLSSMCFKKSKDAIVPTSSVYRHKQICSSELTFKARLSGHLPIHHNLSLSFIITSTEVSLVLFQQFMACWGALLHMCSGCAGSGDATDVVALGLLPPGASPWLWGGRGTREGRGTHLGRSYPLPYDHIGYAHSCQEDKGTACPRASESLGSLRLFSSLVAD